MTDRAAEAREMIQQQIRDLLELVKRAALEADFDSARERLRRWKERTANLLDRHVSATEGERLRAKRKGSFLMRQPLRNLADEADMYRGFLQALDEQLAEHPEEVMNVPVPADQAAPEIAAPSPQDSRTVFIIHGHDELDLLRLKELLRDRWGLNPVVLSGRPGAGRTLIEKFEQEAQEAVFAIALLTPDDIVATEEAEYAQARPNTIFELGWFYGRLGRPRVCLLLKRGTRIHSDLDGIARVEFRESVSEATEGLERELIEAGVLAT